MKSQALKFVDQAKGMIQGGDSRASGTNMEKTPDADVGVSCVGEAHHRSKVRRQYSAYALN